MKKIVIDARESGTTTGRYIDKLIEYLAGLRPEYKIIILTKPARVGFMKQIAPDFSVMESSYKEFSFAEQLGLCTQLTKINPDLVHFNAPQQPLLYVGKSITTVHDLTTIRFNNPSKFWLLFKIKQLIYRFAVWAVAHKSSNIIAVSDFTKNDLVKFAHINPGKVRVIYEAAEAYPEPAKPVSALKSKEFIMYAGRPLPHKNLRRLIDAFSLIQQDHPEMHLALVGKTDPLYDKHKAYVTKKGIKNIIFTGYVSEQQMGWLYKNTSCYIFPSLSEGFGLPGLEAMVYGAPVAASDATSLPEVYGNGAIYFNPLDVTDIKTRVEQVLDDKKLRNDLVQKGFKRVKKYSWRKMAKQTKRVYDEVLAG